MTKEIPIIKATVKWNLDYWDIVIICPYCGREHHHGGGNGDKPSLGHRASHCTGDRMDCSAGYIIT